MQRYLPLNRRLRRHLLPRGEKVWWTMTGVTGEIADLDPEDYP